MNPQGVRKETGGNTHRVVLDLDRRVRRLERSQALVQINNQPQVPITAISGGVFIISPTEPSVTTYPAIWIKTGGTNIIWYLTYGSEIDENAQWVELIQV